MRKRAEVGIGRDSIEVARHARLRDCSPWATGTQLRVPPRWIAAPRRGGGRSPRLLHPATGLVRARRGTRRVLHGRSADGLSGPLLRVGDTAESYYPLPLIRGPTSRLHRRRRRAEPADHACPLPRRTFPRLKPWRP